MYINEEEFRLWWKVFHSESETQLVELRLFPGAGQYGTMSGYFRDIEKALAAVKNLKEERGLYGLFNPIHDDCYEMPQRDRLVTVRNTTDDKNITARKWLFIDIDPDRMKDTNSTDEELELARQKMIQVGEWLKEKGFASPVVAMSGNGYHMFYKVDLTVDKEDQQLVDDWMKVLDAMFSDNNIHIDTKVKNPARIAKVWGSMSRKGSAESATRPQRQSQYIKVPDTIELTDRDTIRKVAALLPKEDPKPRPTWSGANATPFDLDAFISRHGIRVANVVNVADGTKYILEECPFDSSHKAPDSMIFKANSGAVSFSCFHDHCSGHTWQELRQMYEPDAYEPKNRPYNAQYVKGGQSATATEKVPQSEGKGAGMKDFSSLWKGQSSGSLWREISKEPSGILTDYWFSNEEGQHERLIIPREGITFICGKSTHLKSTMLRNLAWQIATNDDPGDVLFFTYEDSLRKSTRRMLNSFVGIQPLAYGKKNSGVLVEYAKTQNIDIIDEANRGAFRDKIAAWDKLLDDGRIRFFANGVDGENLTSKDICALANQYVNEVGRVKAIIVDYIQRVASGEKASDRTTMFMEVAGDLQDYTKANHVPVIAAAQLNRSAKTPMTMSANNIAESINLTQFAETIVLMWNSAKKDDIEDDRFWAKSDKDKSEETQLKNMGFEVGKSGKVYVRISKNKEGETGVQAVLNFTGESERIEPNAPKDEKQEYKPIIND